MIDFTPALLFGNYRKHLMILLLFTSIKGFAQTTEIKNLVFEGAGIRGIAYAGVIEELEKSELLHNIEKVGGTSAGAITALMVALGYTSTEINAIISNTNFNKFNDGRYIFIGGIVRMKNRFGWYRGDRSLKWLEDIIEHKTQHADVTFEELSLMGYKDLYVTATCLNRQKLIVFSKESYPAMKIKDAVRISMSIPLYFQAIFIDSLGTVYKNPDENKDLDIVVDGGITGNFPIFMFDSLAEVNQKQTRIPDYRTIGFRIDSDSQIQSDLLSKELAPIDIVSFNDYITAFYVFVLENLNRNSLTKDDWQRTISISSAGISPRIKKLSKSQKEKLINSGKESVRRFLAEL